MNCSILTVTFDCLSIPIFDGFKSYFNKTKSNAKDGEISYPCFTYSMSNTSWMYKLDKTGRIVD